MMKRTFVFSLFTFTFSLLFAQGNPKRVYLWNEDGADAPYIDIYINPQPSTINHQPSPAVLICPGGGYRMEASYHEGHLWAPFFYERGIATVVLTYRLPHGQKDIPLSDAEQAMRLIRQHAEEWNIDPRQVGIMGFSAGGHLAASVATMAADDARPDFQILFYPVITMQPAYTHRGSHDNLLGKNPSADDEARFSCEQQVDSLTPPAIILMVDDDRSVKRQNGLSYYEALKKQKKPASLHIYPHGGHGFGIDQSFPFHESMLRDLSDWIADRRKQTDG